MAYLEIRGQRHPIGLGETVIGCDTDNAVALGGEDLHTKSAVLQGMPDGQVAVRKADADSEVFINGVLLGPQPTPLLHGDKIAVSGQELLFVDDRRSGSTEYIKAVDPAQLGGSFKSKSKGGATAGTGGRLVSLTDGREYEIGDSSVLIGRDAGCDIVLSAKNVSRRHAEVVATPRGYVLIDNSTNGTIVNDERIKGQHVLSRADVIRCGDHEFRFYADVAEVAEPTSPEPPEPSVSPPEPPEVLDSEAPDQPVSEPPLSPEPPSPPPAPAKGAKQRLANTMHGMPAMPRPGQPPGPAAQPPEARPAEEPEKRSEQETPEPEPGPARGAEQRLAHTMHGLPAMPKPGQEERPPRKDEPAPPPKEVPQHPRGTEQGVPEKGERDATAPTAPPDGADQAPARPERPSRAPKSLASLMVRSGSLKGQRLHVKVPIVNIGRAEYNDVVLPDDSVSTVHAKLQRREGIWVLVDLESTNGTIVDGVRVEDEAPLAPGAIVRFGTIQTIFEPTDDSVEAHLGGGTQVLQSLGDTSTEDQSKTRKPGSGSTPDDGTLRQ